MNWAQIEGKWRQIMGGVQQKWGELTDDEIDEIHGRRDILVGKLQERYGKSKEEAQREVDEWARELPIDL